MPYNSLEKKAKYQRHYYQINREKLAKYDRHRYQINRGKWGEQVRVWAQANPERRAAIMARYRAQKADVPLNDFTAAQWRDLKKAFRYRCAYCKVKTTRLTQDHVIPLSRGGSHTASNIVPACQSCNSSKLTKSASEFRAVLRMLE
ncbi:hypothetical protein LCGC14_2254570 [marine sediment metagenome]|uniref:HNH nuclease domain-containing protein n=1 Tax=marine sediment metagenome TaxID=412755 RepID=A0A0F9FWI8_9ZZZZ